MNEEQQAHADKLASRWAALFAWASGCAPSDYEGAANVIRAGMCDAQGAANLRQKLKKCGAGPWIDHWVKTANPERLSRTMEATALDPLGNDLEQVEKCAVAEGYRLPAGVEGEAGKRLVPPVRNDLSLPFLANWQAALDRSLAAPSAPPAPRWKAGLAGAAALVLVVGGAFVAGRVVR